MAEFKRLMIPQVPANNVLFKSVITSTTSPTFPGKRACTGYEDGTVKVWDLKAGTPLCTLNGKSGL